ncbi:hypothetical protein RJ640_003864 [Escallonia rubra]|uniref:Pentatricopeptide repeat-containing protein n=1 Tax=Escallonia rubra TaxID=112253 RepID=A0AA88QM25_9ASTE|nr:hypothetical protein RJ640_003864 [Escallonia rubra]
MLPAFLSVMRSSILSRPFLLLANKHHYHCSSSSLTSTHLLAKDTTTIASALTFSAKSRSPILGIQTHGLAIKLGFSDDIYCQNNVINMYSKCGVLSDALQLFDEMPVKNLVSWSLIISGASQAGKCQLAVETYIGMTRTGLTPNEFALGSVTKACTSMEYGELGLGIHCLALKIGMEKNPFVGSSILYMYAKFGVVDAAARVFEGVEGTDVGCWNAMIGGYAQCGCGFEAMKTVSVMHSLGVLMDELTFINALNGCTVIGTLDFGNQIHGLVVSSGAELSTSVTNSLMDMYFKNGAKDPALKLFDAMQHKDVVSWNTAFSWYCQDADAREVAVLFHNFLVTGLKPNSATFSILFRFCGDILRLDLGLQLCTLAFHFGFHGEAHVSSSLINMFSNCGAVEIARLVFDSMPFKNINNWNEMISGYNLSCKMEALQLFRNLRELGLKANECTFSCSLEACFKTANLRVGRQIHGIIIKTGFASHGYTCSSVIKCYIGFGLLDDSLKFLSGIEYLDLASWSAMISGLVHQGLTSEAIKFLNNLKAYGEEPDEFILASILNGCASMASHHLTQSVHSLILKTGFGTNVFVASTVVDAYAKCGDIASAEVAFKQSSKYADVALFNTMIIAYAHHGLVVEAMRIFKWITAANLKPSQATFVSVLSACSNMGLVDMGRALFKSITLDHAMEPSPDNYGCLVNMLSRNGFLQEAKCVIESMPFPPWPAIWRSLLNGCRIHGDRQLGEYVANKLVCLSPEHNAAYVLLSNIYSEEGNWENNAKVRRVMTERGVRKELGCSWIGI